LPILKNLIEGVKCLLLVFSFISLLIAGAGVTLMFNSIYIPAQSYLFIVLMLTTFIFYILKLLKKEDGKIAKRIITLSNTIFVVMIISSLAYEHWQWDQIVNNTTMMKICLVLFGVFGLYLNIMYMRAELVYREKRGNQRIKNEPEEGYTEFKKATKQQKDKNGEIVTVIGDSLEHDNVPIILKEKDFFVHSLFVGSTGSGKTASVLEPIAYQLLMQKKLGKKLGLTVVEPKRDFALKVKEYCEVMEIPHIFIDPLSDDTHKFNPMEGDINDVAEATVVVLKGLFGKQEAFFASVQELSARYVTKLLKELNGDNMDILDVMNTLRDPVELKKRVEQLKARDGVTDLVHFFEAELLGQHAEKYRQFVIGLRSQLENITSNDLLKRIMTGKSDVNIQKHFAEGGVLIVNTELGRLGTSGDAFGQFMIMHLQNGTFNRPGPEESRIPHFMIIDEYSRYINPEVERFLSIARSYRVAGIFATQSLGQLEIESGKISATAMKRTIVTNCRNKLVFGGVSADDAEEFANEFGKDKIIMRQSTYKHRIFMPVLFPDSYRDTETEEYRFDPTDIMDGLPKYSYIHKLVYDNQVQKPSLAIGNLVPKNWKELREWENNGFSDKLKRISSVTLEKAKDLWKDERTVVKDIEEAEFEEFETEKIGLANKGKHDEQEELHSVQKDNVLTNSLGSVTDEELDKTESSTMEHEQANESDFKDMEKVKQEKKADSIKKNRSKLVEKKYVPETSGDGFWD